MLVGKVPMPLTTHAFPYLGVRQNKEKPLEKGESPGNTVGPGPGEESNVCKPLRVAEKGSFCNPCYG